MATGWVVVAAAGQLLALPAMPNMVAAVVGGRRKILMGVMAGRVYTLGVAAAVVAGLAVVTPTPLAGREAKQRHIVMAVVALRGLPTVGPAVPGPPILAGLAMAAGVGVAVGAALVVSEGLGAPLGGVAAAAAEALLEEQEGLALVARCGSGHGNSSVED
jgi:hypothetical protein